ncbi:MAG: T9SS C-terminal target domain-containing protein [Candidatus Kapaibacterium sp.]|nr:MAG: T9SS C-terminal target domain-containing protein [Candidatus Kapabacteria bacterium]
MKALILRCVMVLLVWAAAMLIPLVLFAQSAYLNVADPRGNWRVGGQGSIEEATLVVKPRGIYTENDLFFTFSSRGSNATSAKDTLEITFSFALPPDAHVTDSWLWVGDSIVQAKIFDRATASNTYESIVQRRRDPSLLTKEYYGSYTLRIFPMQGNETRKVKISYIMPTTWAASGVQSFLPLELLRSSWAGVPLRLIVHPSPTAATTWKNTRLTLTGTTTGTALALAPLERLTETIDRASGQIVLAGTLQGATLRRAGSAYVEWDSPMRNGLFVQSFTQGSERYYQMAFSPVQVLGQNITRKSLVLIDYDAGRSTAELAEVVNTAKRLMRQHFTPRDSFNIMISDIVSGSGVRRLSPTWVAADSTTIERQFSSVLTMPTLFSNLPRLLISAMNDVKALPTGMAGVSVLLVSNSDGNGSEAATNQLVQLMENVVKPLPPMHIADVANKNYSWYTIRSVNYAANEYLYNALAERSKGTFFHIRSSGRLETTLSGAIAAVGANLQLADLQTNVKEGFCYNRFLLGTNTNGAQTQPLLTMLPANNTILQVGKMVGSGVFSVQAGGFYNGQSFVRTLDMPQSEIQQGDSITKSAWVGNYINALESSLGGYFYYYSVPSRGVTANVPTSTVTREIIAQSVQSRVLSRYTAFLALEPNDTTKVCATCTAPSTGGGGTDAAIRSGGPALGGPAFGGAVSTSVSQTADMALGTRLTSNNGNNSVTAIANITPNPFSEETVISVALSETFTPGTVTMGIYDMLGRLILPMPISAISGGRLNYTWRGLAQDGSTVAAGMYMLIIQTPQNRYTVKLVKL